MESVEVLEVLLVMIIRMLVLLVAISIRMLVDALLVLMDV